MKTTWEEFVEAVEEYGRACADVVSAYEFGTGSATAERYKTKCHDEVVRIASEFYGERPNES
jgi:hypothetical protein